MSNFEQETIQIWSHIDLSFPGHPHEPRQPQHQGPQQVIDNSKNINFLSIMHVHFWIWNCFHMVSCCCEPFTEVLKAGIVEVDESVLELWQPWDHIKTYSLSKLHMEMPHRTNIILYIYNLLRSYIFIIWGCPKSLRPTLESKLHMKHGFFRCLLVTCWGISITCWGPWGSWGCPRRFRPT